MITINHYHHHNYPDNQEKFKLILSLLNKILMTNEEEVLKIEALTAQVEKVAGEVSAVKAALANALAGGSSVPQIVQDAIAKLGSAIQAADDLNVDVVIPPVVTG
jgi:hydroxymethylpyrimidine/phosphomethylpyrimidine kinase